MTDPSLPRDKSIWGRRFFFFGLNVAALAAVFGLLHLLTIAIAKVRSGQGLDTYRTFWLVEFSYVGVLVLFVAIVVALVVSLALWWREERLWRDLEGKYGGNST